MPTNSGPAAAVGIVATFTVAVLPCSWPADCPESSSSPPQPAAMARASARMTDRMRLCMDLPPVIVLPTARRPRLLRKHRGGGWRAPADQIGRLLGDHDDRGVRVRADDARHHRRVGDA